MIMTTIDRIEWVNATADKQKTLLQKIVANKKALILWILSLVCIPSQWYGRTPEEAQKYVIERAKELQANLPNQIYYIKDHKWICYSVVETAVRWYRTYSMTYVPCEKVEPYIYK